MKLFLLYIGIALVSCNGNNQTFYFDNDYPVTVPKIYAPHICSYPDRFEQGIFMRKNGKEHYSTVTGKSWEYLGILRYRYNKEGILLQDTLSFKEYINPGNKGMLAGEACFSNDEKTMYFVSDFPTNIWKVKIDEEGNWDLPVKLDTTVNSAGSEWFPNISHDNCLYFSREINGNAVIHKADYFNGDYKKPAILEATFNYNCGDQVFSKNMDYIIFASPRLGGFGNIDLYIAFKKDNDEWTDGINLGPEINTEGFELAPYISPDDKYLFFTRRDNFEASASDIYWVSLDIISHLKDKM